MNYETEQSIQATKRVTAAREAMAELVNTMNVLGGDKDFAQGIYEGLANQHRTLQQDFMRAFVMAMESYSKINTDLRNEQAVKFAKEITESNTWFPTV